MISSIVVGSTTATVGGLVGAMLGSSLFGTGALPFIIGATVGFAGGLWKYYYHSLAIALVAIEELPSLILLHLDTTFPLYRWRRKGLVMLTDEKRTWVEDSMLITAFQSAGAAAEVRVPSAGR